MIIDITYDASVASCPDEAAFKAGVAGVVSFYESEFSNPVTINIDVGWGEVGGQPLGSGALGESETYLAGAFTYAQVQSALASNATTSDALSAVASLPATDPTGSGAFYLPTSEAKVLGLIGASSNVDGYTGFSSSLPFDFNITTDTTSSVPAGEYDLFGTIAHEFSEVMGRQMGLGGTILGSPFYTAMDLFDFTSPGVRSFDASATGRYFSLDDGVTNLDAYNTISGGDLFDWASSAGDDSYLAFSNSGVANIVTPTDLRVMNVLGYNLTPDFTASNLATNGAQFSLDVSDISQGAATASTTGVYLSNTSTISTADTLLTTVATPAIAASGVVGESVALTFSPSLVPGAYYVGAIADYDGAVTEPDIANSVSNAVPIVIVGNSNIATISGEAGVDAFAPGNVTLGAALVLDGALTVTGALTDTATISGTGTLALASGTDTLTGTTLSVSNLSTTGATLKLGGSITLDDQLLVTASNLMVAAGGATVAGTGSVILEPGGVSRIYGTSASAVFTNDSTISGVGDLGQGKLTLDNAAAGVIDADASGSLILDTAGETATNAGLMGASAGGVLALVSTTVDQSSGGAIEALAGGRINLQDADVIGGSVESVGNGILETNVTGTVLDGSASALTIAGAVSVLNGTNLTLDGAIDDTGKIAVSGTTKLTDLIVGIGGATLSGAGQVSLTAMSRVYGATTAATLNNTGDTITGGGLLGNGQMTLVNGAAGVIESSTVALTIDTGADTIGNAGLIEAHAGGATVKSAIDNTGALLALDGTLTLDGAVTGAGTARINDGTLVAAAAFSENVSFTGQTGVFELANSQAYKGSVTGLSHASASSLDLLDISFIDAATTTASFAPNKQQTAGVLTVTDGTHTAHITLIGDYAGSTFVTSSDGHGGTRVVDPAALRVGGFASTIAAFAPTSLAGLEPRAPSRAWETGLVAAPRLSETV